MRRRLGLATLALLMLATAGGCGMSSSSPKAGIALKDVVVQRDEIPAAYALTDEGAGDDGNSYHVMYRAPDGSRTVFSEARKLASRAEAFDYITNQATQLRDQGYVDERAKDLGDLNFSLSTIGDENEYVFYVAKDRYVNTVRVVGRSVIFGEIYVYSRYMMHNLVPDLPTPSIHDAFSQEHS